MAAGDEGRMGDRFDRKRPGLGERLMRRRGVPPPSILAWGLEGGADRIGHNNGPPLDDDSPGYLWRRNRWAAAHAAAWKTPSMDIVRFRLRRATEAGLDYRSYMLTLLDTGRFAQARDQDADRQAAIATMRAAWNAVMATVAPTASRVDRGIWLDAIIAAYDAPERRHHDVRHIAAMLDDLTAHGTAAQDPDALRLAILFHDIVYDARRTDNEAESASRARIALDALGVGPTLIARVERLVQVTAHLAGAMPLADDRDAQLLLDLDLAILAAPPQRYDAYARDVRQEYAHIADADFAIGRARVLAHFLALPQIYRTAHLHTLWEARARGNLAREHALLNATR